LSEICSDLSLSFGTNCLIPVYFYATSTVTAVL